MKKEEKKESITIDFSGIKDNTPALAALGLLVEDVKNILSNIDNSLSKNTCAVVSVSNNDKINTFAIGATRGLLEAYLKMIIQLAKDNEPESQIILKAAARILQIEASKYD